MDESRLSGKSNEVKVRARLMLRKEDKISLALLEKIVREWGCPVITASGGLKAISEVPWNQCSFDPNMNMKLR